MLSAQERSDVAMLSAQERSDVAMLSAQDLALSIAVQQNEHTLPWDMN
jgi:hypothetical protein